jgi:hypothetical protein
MPRYLACLDYNEDASIMGSIVTVDAYSDEDAFDALVSEHGGSANITILGTCDDIAKLATERGLERSADYVVKG